MQTFPAADRNIRNKGTSNAPQARERERRRTTILHRGVDAHAHRPRPRTSPIVTQAPAAHRRRGRWREGGLRSSIRGVAAHARRPGHHAHPISLSITAATRRNEDKHAHSARIKSDLSERVGNPPLTRLSPDAPPTPSPSRLADVLPESDCGHCDPRCHCGRATQ
jgi:hypothetical protein